MQIFAFYFGLTIFVEDGHTTDILVDKCNEYGNNRNKNRQETIPQTSAAGRRTRIDD